jgi:hypothetical protein
MISAMRWDTASWGSSLRRWLHRSRSSSIACHRTRTNRRFFCAPQWGSGSAIFWYLLPGTGVSMAAGHTSAICGACIPMAHFSFPRWPWIRSSGIRPAKRTGVRFCGLSFSRLQYQHCFFTHRRARAVALGQAADDGAGLDFAGDAGHSRGSGSEYSLRNFPVTSTGAAILQPGYRGYKNFLLPVAARSSKIRVIKQCP